MEEYIKEQQEKKKKKQTVSAPITNKQTVSAPITKKSLAYIEAMKFAFKFASCQLVTNTDFVTNFRLSKKILEISKKLTE
jgi:hypothetical protein